MTGSSRAFRVKMKVSREPKRDPERLDAARQAIGDETELYVDSNGAFSPRQALAWAERFSREWGVTWYDEPVSSADFEGLRLPRDRVPAGLDIAAGEYAYVPADFRNLLLFDGAPEPENGLLRPDRSRPGNGLELKRADAARYAA